MTLTRISSKVVHNGSPVGEHAVTWSAALSNDLPGRFSAGDSLPQRTGSITWTNSAGVAKWVSPFDEHYPKPGDTIQVETTVERDGVSRTQIDFTGVIASTKGGMGTPLVSDIVDNSSDLNRAISWDPLIQRLPARQGTANGARWVGLQYAYPLYEAARRCGFGVRYPQSAGSHFLDVSLCGSLWADRAMGKTELIAAGRNDGFSAPPLFAGIGGKYGLAEGAAVWGNEEVDGLGVYGFFIALDGVGLTPATSMMMQLKFASGAQVALRVEAGAFQADTGSGWETLTTISGSFSGSLSLFFPDTDGQPLWLKVGGEYFQAAATRPAGTGSHLIRPPSDAPGAMGNAPVYLRKSGAGVIRNLVIGRMTSTKKGVQAWKTILDARVADQVFLNLDTGLPPLQYLPGLQASPALASIESICQKLCISTWIDGQGTLHFESGERLRAAPPVLTIDEEGYTPISWQSEYKHSASSIVIHGKTVETQMAYSGSQVLTVWEGPGGDTFLDKETLTHWVKIDDDKDFFEIDTTALNLNARYDSAKPTGGQALTDERWSRHWRGYGSVFAVAKNSQNAASQDFDDAVEGYKVFCTIERVSTKTLKVVLGYRPGQHIPYSEPGIPKRVAQLMYLPEGRGGMPIVRAGASAQLVEAEPLRVSTSGPAGPELIHEMGEYFSAAEYMGEVFRKYFSVPHPYLERLTFGYDSRVGPGVCIRVNAMESWGLSFLVMVTAVEADPASGLMYVTPRVVSATKVSARTYADVAEDFGAYEALEGATYSQIEGG